MIRHPRFVVLLVTAAFAAACSERPARSEDAHRPGQRTEDSSAGTVDLGSLPYEPENVKASATVSGTITLDGPPRQDVDPVTRDQATCGTSAPGAVITAGSNDLSNAVVWVADIKTGKPLPIERRTEVSSSDCQLDPRVQAVVKGTTVNVFNDDKLLHRLVFVRAGTHDTLTVMPFFNVGQVVPSERLAKQAGIVEIRCTIHPWTHGYVLVFDHPYFAVTDTDGKFTIDSLPPGTYRLMVWHEGLDKPIEKQLTVSAGGQQTVDVAVKLPPVASTPSSVAAPSAAPRK